MRALARTPDKLADVPWRDDVEVVRGDLGDPDSLTAAFDGVDVVYYLVHSMGTSDGLRRRGDAVGAATSSTRRARAGVRRIVYLQRAAPRGRAVAASGVAQRRSARS